jgi:hypothetical protein
MDHLDPELISAYIDEELAAADMAAVADHLASCDACRAEYEELRAISTLVHDLPVYLPRREVDLGATESGGSETLAKIIAFSKPLAIAAVILLVAFAGLRLLTDIGQDDSDDGDQISFSAIQPTATSGTESLERASDSSSAGEAPAAAAPSDSESDVMQEAPADSAAAPPRMGAMPSTQGEAADMATAPATPSPTAAPATPAPTVAAAESTPSTDDDSWLAEGIVVAMVILAAGAAGWYRFVRPTRRTPR